jgi:hypothetical protein
MKYFAGLAAVTEIRRKDHARSRRLQFARHDPAAASFQRLRRQLGAAQAGHVANASVDRRPEAGDDE